MDLAILAATFGAIFVVELPDKTFLATLVLATKYRPILVWIGVGLAFLVQTTVAVLLGHAVSFLPEEVVQAAAGVMFLVGAVILIREGRSHQEAAASDEEIETKAVHGWRAILASFLVLFAAEWGDLSQLLTISLVGRYHDAVSVFVGAWAALLLVSGLAVVAGRFLLRYLRLSTIHYVGSAVCFLLAAVTAYQVVAG
jgi:putative Ca2+/H+ antiporter (TMEM165/GDT1 family)